MVDTDKLIKVADELRKTGDIWRANEVQAAAEELINLRNMVLQGRDLQRLESPTFPFVLAFAGLMEDKLEMNRSKGDRPGWLPGRCNLNGLTRHLQEERNEFDYASRLCKTDGSVKTIRDMWYEGADEANLVMMVCDHQTVEVRKSKATEPELHFETLKGFPNTLVKPNV